MMPEGWEEALEMAERYRDYFSERDADIALGRSGTHFFYVYDREHGYFEVFHTFRTAAELEELILGTLAEDLECMNAVMAENLHERFDLTDINETLDNYAPRFHLLREGNSAGRDRQAEEVLLREMPEAVVENPSAGREQESPLHKEMRVLRHGVFLLQQQESEVLQP